MKTPFTINIAQPVIDDMRARLAATRWPDEIDNDDWAMGANKTYLKSLYKYWQHGFDWGKQQAYLNSFSHYKSKINDIGIHYIYEKGKGKTSVPLLLTHGYPDGFVRFLKLIPLLTRGDEHGRSFDVIVPSIPGYGFSDIPAEKGMDPKRIAGIFNELMGQLGYERYFAHGGDWGTSITEQIALYHANSLLGIHLTDVPFAHGMTPLDDPSHAEEKFKKKTDMWVQTEGAYASIQSTKPQSLVMV
jgi:pimeloyl-ACP methyl ester carboxylesterase